MRHLKAHRKLGRTSEHRNSMLRNLATSLINARDDEFAALVIFDAMFLAERNHRAITFPGETGLQTSWTVVNP